MKEVTMWISERECIWQLVEYKGDKLKLPFGKKNRCRKLKMLPN
jgi:hypothetical protein